MTGASSRRKGHQFERDVANEFKELGFPKASRHLEYQMGEAYGVDIAGVYPFRVQVKRHKDYSPISAIEEVQYSRDNGEIPMLITKGDKKPAMAILPWEEMKWLIKQRLHDESK